MIPMTPQPSDWRSLAEQICDEKDSKQDDGTGRRA